jgi:hypothetical protein
MYSLFCVVRCIVWVYMRTVLLPPGGYPLAVKYIISYKNISAGKRRVCLLFEDTGILCTVSDVQFQFRFIAVCVIYFTVVLPVAICAFTWAECL